MQALCGFGADSCCLGADCSGLDNYQYVHPWYSYTMIYTSIAPQHDIGRCLSPCFKSWVCSSVAPMQSPQNLASQGAAQAGKPGGYLYRRPTTISHQSTALISELRSIFWQATRTCILSESFSRGHNIMPTSNPMSGLNMAVLLIRLTVADMNLT